MVTLREDLSPHRSLSIVIGQPEARAILTAWTGSAPSRPSTWDLLVSAVAALEGRILRAVVTTVEEQRHFFATIDIERDGERRVRIRPTLRRHRPGAAGVRSGPVRGRRSLGGGRRLARVRPLQLAGRTAVRPWRQPSGRGRQVCGGIRLSGRWRYTGRVLAWAAPRGL